jgi:hypothetical protein
MVASERNDKYYILIFSYTVLYNIISVSKDSSMILENTLFILWDTLYSLLKIIGFYF